MPKKPTSKHDRKGRNFKNIAFKNEDLQLILNFFKRENATKTFRNINTLLAEYVKFKSHLYTRDSNDIFHISKFFKYFFERKIKLLNIKGVNIQHSKYNDNSTIHTTYSDFINNNSHKALISTFFKFYIDQKKLPVERKTIEPVLIAPGHYLRFDRNFLAECLPSLQTKTVDDDTDSSDSDIEKKYIPFVSSPVNLARPLPPAEVLANPKLNHLYSLGMFLHTSKYRATLNNEAPLKENCIISANALLAYKSFRPS